MVTASATGPVDGRLSADLVFNVRVGNDDTISSMENYQITVSPLRQMVW